MSARFIFKNMLHALLPPLLVDTVRIIKKGNAQAEWEYMPDGWKSLERDAKIKGWNVKGVLETYQRKWPDFRKSVGSIGPLGLSPEAEASTCTSLLFHNILMTYGYVLACATRHSKAVSLLDWGGGIGHYYLISQALIPSLQIDYHCKDVPTLANYGQTLFPEAHFYTDDECFDRTYDFVLASTSLHYVEHWAETFAKLARATTGSLFVTQLPTIQHAPSYVFVQRPYKFGYDTEYLGWCLNTTEFLSCAHECGLTLVREFVVGHQPFIKNAPEQCEYRGFLFNAPAMDTAKQDNAL